MCGDCTRLLCVSALDSPMCGEHLNFAVEHQFPRHRELQKQLLSSKPISHAGLDFVYWCLQKCFQILGRWTRQKHEALFFSSSDKM